MMDSNFARNMGSDEHDHLLVHGILEKRTTGTVDESELLVSEKLTAVSAFHKFMQKNFPGSKVLDARSNYRSVYALLGDSHGNSYVLFAQVNLHQTWARIHLRGTMFDWLGEAEAYFLSDTNCPEPLLNKVSPVGSFYYLPTHLLVNAQNWVDATRLSLKNSKRELAEGQWLVFEDDVSATRWRRRVEVGNTARVSYKDGKPCLQFFGAQSWRIGSANLFKNWDGVEVRVPRWRTTLNWRFATDDEELILNDNPTHPILFAPKKIREEEGE